MLGYALTLDDAGGWHGFSRVLAARLTLAERGALAFAALRSLDPDARAEVSRAAFHDEPAPAGAPLPALLNIEDEAEDWASFADRREHRAFARACLARLHPRDRDRIMADLRHSEARAAK